MARTKRMRRIMGSASSADDGCNNANGEQRIDGEDVAQPSWRTGKVVFADGTIIGGRNIVRGQFYAECSCQNGIASFFVNDVRRCSSSSWGNTHLKVRAKTVLVKNKAAPVSSALQTRKANYRHA